MKKSIKGFVVGLIAGLVISCLCVGAVTKVVQKELHYNDIKVTLNGKEVKPTDANGNYVEPFIIDGTTYLPVRAVANALGLDVNWDSKTSTVKLGKDSSASSGEGCVLYDKGGVKITYQKVVEGTLGEHYKFLVENNSKEEKSVSFGDIYVNGYASIGYGQVGDSYIKPGKKDILDIEVREHSLKEADMEKVETIEFEVRIYPLKPDPIFDEGVYETITLNP